MFRRVVFGFLMLPLLPLVVFFCPPWVLPLAIGILSAIAVKEFLGVTLPELKKRFIVYAVIYSFTVPIVVFYQIQQNEKELVIGFGVLVIVLTIEALAKQISFDNMQTLGLASFFIPFMFSFLVRIAEMENGKHYILLPFAICILCDSLAYFVGSLIGKHKLAPKISPKKTIEGAVAGVFGGVLAMALFALIEQLALGTPAVGSHLAVGNSSYIIKLVIFGVVGSIVAQIGDLAMSAVKRKYGVKDFSNLIPGHGGILDRFDSLLFVAPLCYLLLVLLPLLEVAK